MSEEKPYIKTELAANTDYLKKRIEFLQGSLSLLQNRKDLANHRIQLAKDDAKDSLRKNREQIEKKIENTKEQIQKLREQHKKAVERGKEKANLIELALTEEQFKSWTPSEQRKWIKEHPTSKFAKENTLPKVATPIKPTLSKDERRKQQEQRFLAIIKNKSPEDKKAFLAARKKGIAIPPAWTNIKFNEEPVDGIIAEGIDAKGRKQRVEQAEYRQGKIEEKHERIQKDLEPKFNSIVTKLRRNLNTPENQVLYLITQTGFRIGDKPDGKTEHTAYGASSLLGKHVKVDGSTVTFDFVGKEGIHQHHVIKDPYIAKFVAGKEPEERLFKTSVEKIRNAWKHLGGEKVHDIRSILATRIAKKVVEKSSPPTTLKELKTIEKKAAELASKKLGNRPSEALNTYIDKRVFPSVGEK